MIILINNEIEHKNTFENRVLTEVPKYVLRKMSTSINENETKKSNMLFHGFSINRIFFDQ